MSSPHVLIQRARLSGHALAVVVDNLDTALDNAGAFSVFFKYLNAAEVPKRGVEADSLESLRVSSAKIALVGFGRSKPYITKENLPKSTIRRKFNGVLA